MTRVPTLKELNKLVQKPNYKKAGNWMARNITRDVALPFTWLFLHTPITANQVTVASILVVITVAWFFAQGTINAFFIGAVLFQLWYLIDHIDGQIARYRKRESITGVFLDYISHYFPHLFIFPFISIGLFRNVPDIIYIYVGIMTGAFLALINLIFDSKYKSFFWGVYKYNYYKIKIAPQKGQKAQRLSKPRALFSWLHKFCEIHVIMNVLFLFSVLSFLRFFDFVCGVKFLLFFYAVLSAAVFIPKLAYYVVVKKIDNDFFNTFEK